VGGDRRQPPPRRAAGRRLEPAPEAANALFTELARDRTTRVRRQLADLFYDTANWSEAIVQYRAVIRRDSLATAMVDLGVCYHNLSRPDRPR
jgi:hypothetical protein